MSDTDLIQRVAGRSEAAWQRSLSHRRRLCVLQTLGGDSAACDGGLPLRRRKPSCSFF